MAVQVEVMERQMRQELLQTMFGSIFVAAFSATRDTVLDI